MIRTLGLVLILAAAAYAVPAEEPATNPSGKTVTFASLLDDMVDRTVLARFPDPAYTCRQFSSYDRAAKSPDDHGTWFANRDFSQYLRVEEKEGRKEWVMMDADGPGAVVRIWSANPKGNLRIYLDHAETPVILAPMGDLLDGKWKVPSPLAAERSRGHNLYLPIPYAKHCKITSDSDKFYYEVNYRTYEKGASVTTFTADLIETEADRIARVGKILLLEDGIMEAALITPITLNSSGLGGTFKSSHLDRTHPCPVQDTIPPGGTLEIGLPAGPAAVRRLEVMPVAEENTPLLPISPRHLVVQAEFDGIQTLWCPAGDFFGAGVGADRVKDFYRYYEDGPGKRWISLWPMPYAKTGKVTLKNLSDRPVHLAMACRTEPWEWDDRSMHFYARWRFDHPLPTRPMRDYNYVEIKGKGVYVGDTLTVINPVPNWWGEGDEKIYVDGETFPSHFGTGTEDYYGYAWCCNVPFEAPFHGQPRCDGHAHGNNWGHTTVSRVRALDAIPFEKSLRFDMEVWHWATCEEGYGVATFFYAAPGAFHNRIPLPGIVKAPIPVPTPLPPPFTIEGAIECETMTVKARSEGLPMESQNMKGYAKKTFSGDTQLWARGREKGDFVELGFKAPAPGKYRVFLHATRSWDYGVMRFKINGTGEGVEVDLFNRKERKVAATGPIDLGIHVTKDGKFALTAEVVGGHPRSEGTKSYFGLDCVTLKRED